jgi:hypothetical protein
MAPKKFKPNPFVAKGPALTETEIRALRDVADRVVVPSPLLQRLEALGLIEQKLGAWTTTHQGEIRLLFAGAR